MTRPGGRYGGDHRIGEALDAWLRDQGRGSAGDLAGIHRCWEGVVGPEVAAHVRPVALRDEALILAVDHPTWATQVGFLAPQLLARLAEALGRPAARRLETTVRHNEGVE